LIGKCGIVSRRFAEKATDAFEMYRDPNISPDSEAARDFRMRFGKREYVGAERRQADHRPLIKYLGIFDTVGQRGLPSALGPLTNWANKRSPSKIWRSGRRSIPPATRSPSTNVAAPFPPPAGTT
jgi:uncharacterized protein (DUF2235 family)